MSEKAEDVAKELEHVDSDEIDDAVLEDVSGGQAEEEANVNNINGSC